MSFTGTEFQKISFEDAAKITRTYRGNDPGGVLGEYFSKDSIMELLNQTGAVGIRVYYGINENREKELIVVAVDSDENDMIGEDYCCIEHGRRTPPFSGDPNILNS